MTTTYENAMQYQNATARESRGTPLPHGSDLAARAPQSLPRRRSPPLDRNALQRHLYADGAVFACVQHLSATARIRLPGLARRAHSTAANDDPCRLRPLGERGRIAPERAVMRRHQYVTVSSCMIEQPLRAARLEIAWHGQQSPVKTVSSCGLLPKVLLAAGCIGRLTASHISSAISSASWST
jgi:hypothetical protein